MAVLYKIRIPERAANFMNHGSLPVGDKHYNKIWLALHVTFRPTNRVTLSPECRAAKAYCETTVVSLFAHFAQDPIC